MVMGHQTNYLNTLSSWQVIGWFTICVNKQFNRCTYEMEWYEDEWIWSQISETYKLLYMSVSRAARICVKEMFICIYLKSSVLIWFDWWIFCWQQFSFSIITEISQINPWCSPKNPSLCFGCPSLLFWKNWHKPGVNKKLHQHAKKNRTINVCF